MKVALSQFIKLLLVADPKQLTDQENRVEAVFKSYWPGIEPHLRSFREKPNCDCRFDIMDAIRNAPGLIPEALRDLRKTDLEIDLQAGEGTRAPTVIRGLVRDIPDTPEAYSALMQECADRNHRFLGVSVRVLEPGTVRIYFY